VVEVTQEFLQCRGQESDSFSKRAEDAEREVCVTEVVLFPGLPQFVMLIIMYINITFSIVNSNGT